MTTDWCVLWHAESRTLSIAQREQMLNHNAAALLDQRQGACPVRMDMTYEQAKRYADAMQQTIRPAQGAAA